MIIDLLDNKQIHFIHRLNLVTLASGNGLFIFITVRIPEPAEELETVGFGLVPRNMIASIMEIRFLVNSGLKQ